MHRKVVFGTMLALVAAMVLIGAAAAHGGGTPVEPTCPLPSNPLATLTVTPAVWNPATYACPVVSFTASRSVVDVDGHYIYADKVERGHPHHDWACPTGYSSNPGHSNCRKWVDPTYKTEVFGPISVVYGDKSSDQNHCHRPTGSSLDVPSWAMSDFNKLPEHKETIKTDGYWTNPVCAVPPVYGCMDPLALNFDPLATEPDKSCLYLDLCSNLEGNQAVMPQGYEDPNQDGVCTLIPEPIPGCMDDAAINYDPLATVDDQSCEYPPVCEDSEALNVGQEGECVYFQPSPEPEGCQSDKSIWIWDLQDSVTGQWFHLRDLGYDGTYDSPGRDQQCFYFGCDFVAARVWGHYVSECDSEYQAWYGLPRYAGGGKCPLPTGPSQ
jgi:hypothetical protein